MRVLRFELSRIHAQAWMRQARSFLNRSERRRRRMRSLDITVELVREAALYEKMTRGLKKKEKPSMDEIAYAESDLHFLTDPDVERAIRQLVLEEYNPQQKPYRVVRGSVQAWRLAIRELNPHHLETLLFAAKGGPGGIAHPNPRALLTLLEAWHAAGRGALPFPIEETVRNRCTLPVGAEEFADPGMIRERKREFARLDAWAENSSYFPAKVKLDDWIGAARGIEDPRAMDRLLLHVFERPRFLSEGELAMLRKEVVKILVERAKTPAVSQCVRLGHAARAFLRQPEPDWVSLRKLFVVATAVSKNGVEMVLAQHGFTPAQIWKGTEAAEIA